MDHGGMPALLRVSVSWAAWASSGETMAGAAMYMTLSGSMYMTLSGSLGARGGGPAGRLGGAPAPVRGAPGVERVADNDVQRPNAPHGSAAPCGDALGVELAGQGVQARARGHGGEDAAHQGRCLLVNLHTGELAGLPVAGDGAVAEQVVAVDGAPPQGFVQ